LFLEYVLKEPLPIKKNLSFLLIPKRFQYFDWYHFEGYLKFSGISIGTIWNILSVLAPIDKGHNKGNEGSRRENNTDNIKANKSKIKPTTDTEGAYQETENKTQERFTDISIKKFLFKGDAMECLFFCLCNEPISKTGDDRIILLQNFRGRELPGDVKIIAGKIKRIIFL
jgi:hypothetical protein